MDEAQVRKAVLALHKFHSTRPVRKRRLIEENPLVSLIIGLKKTPNRSFKPHRILIPHSLYPPEETELCLFSRTDKKTAKELLQRKGVTTINKVIPLDKLKTDYKSFESKKHLSAYYDVYLADRRIYHLLPRHLGKSFFIKKRFPFPVDVQKQDLSREIAIARDSTYLHLGLGSCVAVPIGRIGYPVEHIVANIMRGMAGVISKIPRGWRNIQAVQLKTVDSIALPVYNSLPPEPKLLAPVNEEPKQKRVKLEDASTGQPAAVGVEGGQSAPLSAPLAGELEGEESNTVQRGRRVRGNPAAEKRTKATSVPRLARKKVRGSTVISSQYEKMAKKKLRRRISS
jgi:ribosome biogenesis protein UTP30